MLLKILYTILWQIAPPFIRRYLNKRAQRQPAYAAHWDERFGKPFADPVQRPIWIHAVSLGETRAARPLVEALRRRFPDSPLLLTQMTPTGRAAAEALFPEAQCRYLPYDRADWVRQFLQEHRPRFGVLMETEIWPNLMAGCSAEGVPLFLANARLSESSQRGYLKARSLIAPAMQTLAGCFAQTEADAGRLKSIGAANVQVCSNTKYDIVPDKDMHTLAAGFRRLIGKRQVVVCASTRFYKGEDEAEILLKAWQDYHGDALLVIVPRHPERFQTACDTARSLGFKVQRRSSGEHIAADTQVWIGDSMGELAAYYLSADIAFVGGSLVDSGCQNIIEAVACGLPTLFGPSTYNFAQACAEAQAVGAAKQVSDAQTWLAQTRRWLEHENERRQTAANAQHWIAGRQGGSEQTAAEIAKIIVK
ncbi:lipid IV(A) 3-deoxy-D-manno-octulosonic acid transferase [Neisseria sp. ZJ106]|uniref:3-deoxy-D-manno-octulosonic acid transferase n=1 Tax=Neisseria lisongii TaxID=2912188 RepID=A0ABY7RKB8_9NEIS|nr:lipid IV(A) 3-deoxy-D-manno-octulosonic acid transferase [Neisseria lisongii]MCF7520971.1 lipid IV(A) 3-deoxy-D-manno-octulosonic acid transferase [Neisseria lisongii]WCL71226.1 lipid IV(A) 3-deoxy-D-manno-octulosonic acid transferase [Neisseria lisongii]